MSRTGCCLYTTRCYDFDGNTIWRNNYFQGSKGTPPPGVLGVAVDVEDNVYVCGPTAIALHGPKTWSLISYTPDAGEIRWKMDIRAMGRAFSPAYASWSGDMLDVCCTADNRIVCIGVPFPGSSSPFNNVTEWAFNPDGSVATAPAFGTESTFTERAFTTNNQIAVTPFSFTPSSAACARGAGHYLTDVGLNQLGGTFFNNMYATIAQMPTSPNWMLPYTPTLPEWGFWGTRQSHVGDTAATLTICTSRDRSKVYASGNGLRCVLNGICTEPRSIIRLIPDIGYQQTTDTGLAPLTGAGDTIVWGLTGITRGESIGIDGAVVMAGGGVPHIQAYADADGSKVWAHNHHLVENMAATADRLFTVGAIQLAQFDTSFV